MKKGLLIAFAVLMLAGSLSAGDMPYIGIFASPMSVEDTHSICSISPVVTDEIFVLWIWVLPSSRGMAAVEFKLVVPTGMTLEMDYPTPEDAGEVRNPDINIQLGTLTTGVSSVFSVCEYGWTWTHKRWYSSRNVTPRSFSVAATNAGKFQLANCDLGNPKEPLTKLNNLHLYQACVYGTKDATWGAIKSLF